MWTRVALALPACLGLTVVLLAGDAPAETKKLEGQWSIVVAEKNGQKAPADVLQLVLTISGNKLSLRHPDANVQGAERDFTFTLDPTKKPHWIDLVKAEDPQKGDRGPGIYKLVGNELTICIPEGDNADRPTEFAAPEGSRLNLITFKKK